MNQNSIVIKGAREHNLKNIDLEIPRDKLVVFTDFLVREKVRLRSIRFLPTVSAGIWKAFLHMHGSFSV